MKGTLLLLLVTASLAVSAQAPVQNFTLTNVADDTGVSLEGCPTCAGVVVVFTSNVCPYDNYYIGRIKSLVTAYQGRMQFMLINSYLEPEEGADKMKTAYQGWNLPVPYLADKEQVAMGSLGARKSPEVFLLKNVSGKYIVVYSGALDDNPQVPDAVSQNYLKAAIDKLLAGQEIDAPMVRAVGCSIRKK